MSEESAQYAEAIAPEYTAARTALLDSLEVLQAHFPGIVVVGAQAIYLRTGSADLAISPYTTDADLALYPSRLAQFPELEQAMAAAGFSLGIGADANPGSWTKSIAINGTNAFVPVDLIVPEELAGPGGRRGARLQDHDNRAARRAVGLEACLVDRDAMVIESFDPDRDRRQFAVNVAGLSGLLVAKAHKIFERIAQPNRMNDKDAGDVFRIMKSLRISEAAAKFRALAVDPLAATSTTAALGHLEHLFGSPRGKGVEMAKRSFRLAVLPEEVESLCPAFTNRLLDLVAGPS